MTFDELETAVDKLRAFDEGATDSGVHDEALKEQVRAQLAGLADDELRLVLSRLARNLLSDEALAQGYGYEDVVNLLRWLEDLMGWDLVQ